MPINVESAQTKCLDHQAWSFILVPTWAGVHVCVCAYVPLFLPVVTITTITITSAPLGVIVRSPCVTIATTTAITIAITIAITRTSQLPLKSVCARTRVCACVFCVCAQCCDLLCLAGNEIVCDSVPTSTEHLVRIRRIVLLIQPRITRIPTLTPFVPRQKSVAVQEDADVAAIVGAFGGHATVWAR